MTSSTCSSVERHATPEGGCGLLEIGTVLGDWRIERLVGLGGMGTVYEAVHTLIGKRAAIKVVRADMTPGTRERFVREAKVVNQIEHPGVVDIFEIGRLEDGRPYLVMELLPGKNLDDRMDDGRIRPDDAITILLQVASAIAAAHAHGVVHRDLKPANIIVVSDDAEGGLRVKVVDWGIAKVMGQLSEPTSTTLSGTLLGTPEHMSPEQARGDADIDGRTDIYALGSIAYELFLEEPPFNADSIAEVLAMHLREAPPPPSDVWPDIPPALEQLLLSMLAKHPADRPCLDEVIETLLAVRRELAVRKHEHVRRGARESLAGMVRLPRRRTVRALALTAVLGIGAGVLALGRGDAPVTAGDYRLELPTAEAAAAALPLPDPIATRAESRLPAPSVTPAAASASSSTKAATAKAATSPVKNRSARRRSAPRIDPDGTIDPFR